MAEEPLDSMFIHPEDQDNYRRKPMSDNSLAVIDAETGELIRQDVAPDFAISLSEHRQRLLELQRFVKEQMVVNEDYGVIPGTGGKPALFKPGAEKLNAIFGLAPQIEIVERHADYEAGFFAYEIKVTLLNKRTGAVEAEGVGSCNNKEKRFRNQDAAGTANNVLKQAKKRALVDATLTATRVSGLFTQDIEEAAPDSNELAIITAHYNGLHFAAAQFGIMRDNGKPWPIIPPTMSAADVGKAVVRLEAAITEFVRSFSSIKAELSDVPVEPDPDLATPIGDAAKKATADRAEARKAMDKVPPPPEPKTRTERQAVTGRYRAIAAAKGLDLSDTPEARSVRYAAMSGYLGKAEPVQSMKGFTDAEIGQLTQAIEAGTLTWDGPEVQAA